MGPIRRPQMAMVLACETKSHGDTLQTSIDHAGDIHKLGTPESTPSKILHDMDVNLEEHLKRHRMRTSGRIW